jgi:hypothetical protein
MHANQPVSSRETLLDLLNLVLRDNNAAGVKIQKTEMILALSSRTKQPNRTIDKSASPLAHVSQTEVYWIWRQHLSGLITDAVGTDADLPPAQPRFVDREVIRDQVVLPLRHREGRSD